MALFPKTELLPGTLDCLVLAVLNREPLHGYAIAQRIKLDSGELLRAEEGSLYPALQRLLAAGWVSAAWTISGTNRRVRVYTLTSAGRKQLKSESKRVSQAIAGILRLMRVCES